MDNLDDVVIRDAFAVQPELMAYALALLGDYNEAQDVVQETMLVVVRKHDQFEPGTSVLAWCRAILRIEVQRLYRRKKQERSLNERLLADAIDGAFERFQKDSEAEIRYRQREILQACLDRLPGKSADILFQRIVGNSSYLQISELLGMSVEGVRKSLFRSRRRLKECVQLRLQETAR